MFGRKTLKKVQDEWDAREKEAWDQYKVDKDMEALKYKRKYWMDRRVSASLSYWNNKWKPWLP